MLYILYSITTYRGRSRIKECKDIDEREMVINLFMDRVVR